MDKLIAIGLSPNTQRDDILLATKNLLMPWKYQKGNSVVKLEQWFKNYFEIPYAIAFSNGRSALFAILNCLEIGRNDEVILQAFTCIVVPNAIIATGAKPVYADIDDSLTIDPIDLEKKITKKTKAIIVLHSFGIPSDMDRIMNIAKRHNLFIIEDVAHTIGGEYKEKKLGTFGIASIFSFGRDKAFSSVFGGIALTRDKTLGEKMQKFRQEKKYPSTFWIFQQLFYPIICSSILNHYYFFSIGKIFHFLLRRIHFLSFPVDQQERKGVFSSKNIYKFPNGLASLACLQVQKLHMYNKKRKNFLQQYLQTLKNLPIIISYKGEEPLMRFPILVDDKQKIKKYFFQRGIYIGDWYNQVIDPVGSDLEKVFYTKGLCLNAEKIAEKIINLPTQPTITKEDVERVIRTLKEYYLNYDTNKRNI